MSDLKVGDLILARRWISDGAGLYRVNRLTPKRAYVDEAPEIHEKIMLPGTVSLEGTRGNDYVTTINSWDRPAPIIVTNVELFSKCVKEAWARFEYISELKDKAKAEERSVRTVLMNILIGMPQ